MLTLQQLHAEAERLLEAAPEGGPLEPAIEDLIAFVVRISVTSLDPEGARPHAERALQAGVTPAQLKEAVFLVSGLGVHSLFEGLGLVDGIDGPPEPQHLADTKRQ